MDGVLEVVIYVTHASRWKLISQSGRFGKLNKRVSFPETLDLSPYMSEAGEDNNVYKLYAVIVHVDMLNASFFGHYICYIKDFRGNWYRIDDCKIKCVDVGEVLSQGAYMLLYSRIFVRPSSLYPTEPLRKDKQENPEAGKEDLTSDQCHSTKVSYDTFVGSGSLPSDDISKPKFNSSAEQISLQNNSEDVNKGFEEEILKENFPVPMDVEISDGGCSVPADRAGDPVKHSDRLVRNNTFTGMDSSEIDILKIEHRSSLASEVEDETGDSAGIAKECSIDNGSVPTQNHVNEKGMPVDDFAAASSSGVDLTEMKSANFREKMRKAGNGDLPSSNIVQDAAGRLDGRRSRANLKPLFTPGFLGRHPQSNLKPLFASGFPDRCPQNRSFKGEVKFSVELGEEVCSGNINYCTNGIATPGFSCENGGPMRNWETAHSGYRQNRSSANILEKQINMSHEETQIASNVSIEPADLAYDNSEHPSRLDKSTNGMTGMLAGKQTPVFEDKSR